MTRTTKRPPDHTAKLVTRPFSEVVGEEVGWLLDERVPYGMLTVFAGEPKSGKSLATLAIAAALSRGRPQPLTPPGEARDVVLLNAEDHSASVVRPRLEAAGADMARVHQVQAVHRGDDDPASPFDLGRDVALLAEKVESVGAGLVVIDPISAYLPRGATENGALRRILMPLKKIAEDLNAAVVVVTHLTKRPQSSAKNRIIGSIGLAGVARSNFIFEPADGGGVMTDVGCNLAAPRPLAYRIDPGDKAAALVWLDEIDERSEDVASPVVVWLADLLAGGSVSATEVFARGAAVGLSEDQLKGAKLKLGAQSKRVGFGPGSHIEWVPPANAPLHRGDAPLCALCPPQRLALPAPERPPGREIVLWRPPAESVAEAA
ncbi:MAG: AAA family ATPase [Paludisphaera borealis]|uniref:AAA family ATPase n=1 Tax=Paludisphaera borealis TaxID=1387353 RepID=UPI00283AECAF|nr:AAA family ATPase [Paludisphaera borealis]MDR3619227.1 AAA family ATPase [Paludisphaera borealis]